MALEGIDGVLKINPVVELKEDTENHVYKADFRGHLQLVNIAEDIAAPCNTAENNQSDQTDQWKSVKSPLQSSDADQQFILSWEGESTDSFSNLECKQTRNMANGSVKHKTCISKDGMKDRTHSEDLGRSFPEIYDPSSETVWEQQADNSNHSLSSGDFSISEDMIILTQAEKKKLYRMRIKDENPALWSTIKEREAARKRELREKRRNVIYEMQKALEVTSLPDSPEFSNQQLYLEALKERYPDIWNQLVKALPDTEQHNERLYYDRSGTRNRKHSPKPTSMYKDVIEAQKKRVYRQRLKEERPEMYERQKARDAYARSIQRLLLKNNESSLMGYYMERQFPDVEMHHSQPDNLLNIKSEYISMDSKDEISDESTSRVKELPPSTFTTVFPTSPVTETSPNPCNSISKSVSHACDNEHEKDNFPSEISSNSCDNLPNIYSEPHKPNQGSSLNESHTASATQSNMLWYWNDVKSESPDWTTGQPQDLPRYDTKDFQRDLKDFQRDLKDFPRDHKDFQRDLKEYQRDLRDFHRDLTEEQRLEKIERERLYLKEKRKRYRLAMSPERRAEFLRSERERLKKYRIKKKVNEET